MRSPQRKMPEAIKNAPELELGLGLFLTGFFDLTGSRVSGMSVGEIPWIVVQEYCVALDLEMEQTEDMHYHIAALDAVWLKKQNTGGT